MTRATVLFLFFLLWSPGLWAQSEETWFAVFLDERQIGHLQSSRQQHGDAIESRTALQLELQRNGEPMQVRSAERALETVRGRPLEFSSEFDTNGTHSKVSGRIDDQGLIVATIEQGGAVREVRIPWPHRALLAEGQRQALKSLSDTPGSSMVLRTLDPTSLNVMITRSETIGYVAADPALHLPRSLHVRQYIGRSEPLIQTDVWLDAESRQPLRMRLPALGLQLEFRACSKACALATPEPADVLLSTLVDSPRALGARERGDALRFLLKVDGARASSLAEVPGQYLGPDGETGVELLVDPAGAILAAPTAADTAATRWLQSDDEAVQALADSAGGKRQSPLRQMRRLENVVRDHIQIKSMRIGYASAAEVIELREGDCTEHAVLLAALARSRGIPARIVTGLAYAPRFGKRQDVFVPHAWVMAWVDGRWRGFDAAMPRFDAAHIGLTMGSGDPFDFYAGLDLLGRLRIVEAEPASRRELAAALGQSREPRS